MKYCSTLNNLIAIARSLGVNFFFEDKDGTIDLSKDFEAATTELGRRPDKLQIN